MFILLKTKNAVFSIFNFNKNKLYPNGPISNTKILLKKKLKP